MSPIEEEDSFTYLHSFRKEVLRHMDTYGLDLKYVCMKIGNINSSIQGIEKSVLEMKNEQAKLKSAGNELTLRIEELQKSLVAVEDRLEKFTENNTECKREVACSTDNMHIASTSIDSLAEESIYSTIKNPQVKREVSFNLESFGSTDTLDSMKLKTFKFSAKKKLSQSSLSLAEPSQWRPTIKYLSWGGFPTEV